MLRLVLGLGVRLGGIMGGVVLPSHVSGGKGVWSYPVMYQVVGKTINVFVNGDSRVQHPILRLKYRIQTFSYLRDRIT